METSGRRYPRVLLTKGIQNFSKIAGIEVVWPKGQITGAIDISYIGAAIVQPQDHSYSNLEKGERLSLEFHFLENNKRVLFNCEVVRVDDRCIAFHFPELSVEARKILQKFMQSKLVGAYTKLVDPKFYIKEQGFNYWFHGPNQTNIFIWGDKKRIQRVTIELESRVLTMDNGEMYEAKSTDFLFVPTEDYAHQVNNTLERLKLSSAFVKQVVAFLAEVPDTKGLIDKILKDMTEKK